jgi:phosphoglycerate dehydrogenase-like enzyme
MIAAEEIKQMKPGAILVNTCRGGVVDEKEILSALDTGHLYGYGTDVYEEEPSQFTELIRHAHVVSAPHIAGASEDGLMNMATITAEKVIKFLLNGDIPNNVLNPKVIDSIIKR